MTLVIDCPCGHRLTAGDREALVRTAREHVGQSHPEMTLQDGELRELVLQKAYDPSGRNVAVVRRVFEEVWNAGNADLVDELFTADYVNHDPASPELPPGPAGARRHLSLYLTAFPDVEFTLDETIATEDRVVVRFRARGTHRGPLFGISPTGRRVGTSGVAVHRLEGGRIVEAWVHWDALGLMQQLGVVPRLQPA